MSRYTGLFRLYPMTGYSSDGFVDHDKEVIKKSVYNIIMTHKGSRIYDPEYGTNIHRLIHEQNIQRTRNIAKTEIQTAIATYEPRAKIVNIDAFPGEGEFNHQVIIIVTLLYVEYGVQEDLEIRLKTEQQWISKEGRPIDPVADWFKNGEG